MDRKSEESRKKIRETIEYKLPPLRREKCRETSFLATKLESKSTPKIKSPS